MLYTTDLRIRFSHSLLLLVQLRQANPEHDTDITEDKTTNPDHRLEVNTLSKQTTSRECRMHWERTANSGTVGKIYQSVSEHVGAWAFAHRTAGSRF